MTDTSSLVEVVSRFLPLKQNGAECHARCVFHADEGESLRVGLTWRCLGCAENEVNGSDAAGFLMSWSGCTREDAEHQLGNGGLPPAMPVQVQPLRRACFWGLRALLEAPKAIVWVHWVADGVHFGREHLSEGRVHLGLCSGRPIDDESISLLDGRSCILIPDNRESSFERMDELASKLYAAGHAKVRYVRVQDQEDCYAWPSGLTPEQALTFVQEHVLTYPNNAAQQMVATARPTGDDRCNAPSLFSSAAAPNALPSGISPAVSAPGPQGGAPISATPVSCEKDVDTDISNEINNKRAPRAPDMLASSTSLNAAPTPAPAVASGHHPLVAPPIDTAGVGDAPKPRRRPPPAPPGRATIADPPPVDASGPPKPASLILGEKGAIRACEHNAKELMAAAKQYDGLHFDKFLYRVRLGEGGEARDWSDGDDRDAVCWLQSAYQVSGFTLNQTRTAALALAHARPHDSLFEFVMGLPEWDGTPRIERAFTDAWGAPDTALMHAASRNFFIALHARAVKPGAQVDNLWAIEGPQGKLKSASLRALGEHFHAEISAQIGTADFLRELRGIWIAELSELDSLRGREASTVKRLLSAPSDRFVEKYEKHASAYARRAVAVATTNEAAYWQDSTGARRLIPIAVTNIRLDLIAELRLQWFAEARHLYQAGATWWEFPEGMLAEQEERQAIDPWEDTLRDAIENGQLDQDGYARPWPEGWIASAVIMRDWLKLTASQQGRSSSTRLGHLMRRLGFSPRRSPNGSERGWMRR